MGIEERLRQERHRHHLSQEALADMLNVSVQSISRWERGVTLPQAHYRLELSRFFDIRPGELFEALPMREQQHSTPTAPAIWSVPIRASAYRNLKAVCKLSERGERQERRTHEERIEREDNWNRQSQKK